MSSNQPRVIVGLDFGTSFSGFAFAHTTESDTIYCYYDYPGLRGSTYCKTLTASYYKQNLQGVWEFKSWGYQARAEYERDITAFLRDGPARASVGAFVTKFKLHLAGREMGPSIAQPLPPGLTVNTLVTDYLRAMGDLILGFLDRTYRSQLSMKEIQWCITVPSIWDNAAKSTMKTCMANAGLVNGAHGSPHPLTVVLEPEAASFHCHKVP